MKCLWVLLFSSVLLVGCSGDSDVDEAIIGKWRVSVAGLNVNLNQGELAVLKPLSEKADTDPYLSQEEFIADLQSFFNNSEWEFSYPDSFTIVYQPSKYSSVITKYTGIYRMSGTELVKYYSGSAVESAKINNLRFSGGTIILNIRSKTDFINAFGYELPAAIYKTAEEMLVSMSLDIQITRK